MVNMSDGVSGSPLKKRTADATGTDEVSTSASGSAPKKAKVSTPFQTRKNSGEWSSEELKKLYTSIKRRGCKPEDVPLLAIDVLTRSTDQVIAKLAEIRKVVSTKRHSDAHVASPHTKKERLQVFAGTADERNGPAGAVKPWLEFVKRLQQERVLIDTSTQCLASVLELFSKIPVNRASKESSLQFCMTTDPMSRHYLRTEKCEFSRIYLYLSMCIRGQTPHKLRCLEASVLLKLLEEVKEKIEMCDTSEQKLLLQELLEDFKQGTLDTTVEQAALLPTDALPEPDVYSVNPLCIRPDLLPLSPLPDSTESQGPEDGRVSYSPEETVIID